MKTSSDVSYEEFDVEPCLVLANWDVMSMLRCFLSDDRILIPLDFDVKTSLNMFKI